MAKNRNRNKNNTAQAQRPLVIQTIEQRPALFKQLDVRAWNSNRKSALALIPRRTGLYDMYADIMDSDGQIIAVWGKRLDEVFNAPWEFTDKTGKPVDAINELIDSHGFEALLDEIMSAKLWGYAAAEFSFWKNRNGQAELSVYSIPKKHIRPLTGIVTDQQDGDTGTNIRQGIYLDTIAEFGNEKDLGLMLAASLFAILKRGTLSDWAEFIEIFGRGIVDAEWDGIDESQRKLLAQAIKEMGGGGVIIRPAGTSVDIKNNTGNANGALQDTFVSKMDGYISKCLLGTTETTEASKSSGYAQASIHQDQDEKKNESDLNYVRRYLNSRFIPILQAAGFDTKGGTFVLKKKRNLNKEAFDIHKSMRNDLKIPIDDDFFYEEYSVRKPDNYQELKDAMQPVSLTGNIEEDTPDEKPTDQPESKKQLAAEQSLLKRILRLFHSAPEVKPAGAITCCGDHLTIRLASFVSDNVFSKLSDGLIRRAWEAAGKLIFDPELFDYTAKALTDAFIQGFHKKQVKLVNLGFQYDYADPAILTAFEMNLFRFAGCKTLYEAQQLNQLFRKAKSFDEFYQQASQLLKVHNREWLQAEYNTANAAGESAGNYQELIKQTDVFEFWEYCTVQDNRVRESHRILNGVILRWDHPAWDKIFPPNGWNCRCYIVGRTRAEVTEEQLKESEARVKDYFATDEFKKSAKGGWGINRAKKGLVFTENQHYTSDYLDALGKMDKISFERYGLERFQRYAQEQEEKERIKDPDKDRIIDEFISQLKVIEQHKYAITDFNGRELIIKTKTISKHTTDSQKYFDRHIFLNRITEILQSPDEVWLNDHGRRKMGNYIYIKNFDDVPMAVSCELYADMELQITSWFNLLNDDLRRGLLIQRK